MKEELVRPKEVLKSCFFVGCLGFVILALASIAYLIWLFTFYDPYQP